MRKTKAPLSPETKVRLGGAGLLTLLLVFSSFLHLASQEGRK